MKGYRYNYTIERAGGVETEVKDLPLRIEIDAAVPMTTITTLDGRILQPMCNVVRIIEEEVEI